MCTREVDNGLDLVPLTRGTHCHQLWRSGSRANGIWFQVDAVAMEVILIFPHLFQILTQPVSMSHSLD